MRKAMLEYWEGLPDAWLLYGDVGYGVIYQGPRERVLNVGIAEQTMVLMAAGLASRGKVVYTYAIAPHYLRAWEFIRNLVADTGRDITLVAVGVGDDYKALGKTHCIGVDELSALCFAISLPYYCPTDRESLDKALRQPGPKMLHLSKASV